MDSEYIITPSGSFISTDELYHHGIKGMKWGVRRYQNADGSLTEKGRKRYLNSDGTLNKKGEKYYAKETERLKAERKTLRAQKSAVTKLSKLEEMRKKNAELENEVNGKKTKEEDKSSSGESASTSKNQSPSDMSDSELQTRVNRLRNEDAYRDLSKKLGYDSSKTELDIKIADMEKQKKYLELQRDIKNLTPQKTSKTKQFVGKLMSKVIEPAATEAGKKLLTQYLTEAGAQVLGKTAKKEASKIEKTDEKSTEKAKTKQAKQEAKAAKKEAKAAEKQAKQEAKNESKSKVYEGTVEGEGTSRSSIKNGGKKGPTYDAEYYTESHASTPVTDLSTTSRSRGYDYIERIKTDYGYRYIYELPSGS
jgi:hypothetical protein